MHIFDTHCANLPLDSYGSTQSTIPKAVTHAPEGQAPVSSTLVHRQLAYRDPQGKKRFIPEAITGFTSHFGDTTIVQKLVANVLAHHEKMARLSIARHYQNSPLWDLRNLLNATGFTPQQSTSKNLLKWLQGLSNHLAMIVYQDMGGPTLPSQLAINVDNPTKDDQLRHAAFTLTTAETTDDAIEKLRLFKPHWENHGVTAISKEKTSHALKNLAHGCAGLQNDDLCWAVDTIEAGLAALADDPTSQASITEALITHFPWQTTPNNPTLKKAFGLIFKPGMPPIQTLRTLECVFQKAPYLTMFVKLGGISMSDKFYDNTIFNSAHAVLDSAEISSGKKIALAQELLSCPICMHDELQKKIQNLTGKPEKPEKQLQRSWRDFVQVL